MIEKILIKKIKKGKFGKKDTFLKIDITPSKYYKLNTYDKTYFTKVILGLNMISIKSHDDSRLRSEDDIPYTRTIGNEFAYSYKRLLNIWEKHFWKPKEQKKKRIFDEILMEIIKDIQKQGKDFRAIFVLSKD